MDIKEKITQTIACVLSLDPESINNMSEDQTLNSMGMDSLNSIDVVLSLEDEFGISFTEDELLLQNLNTINKLKQIIEQKLAANV